MDPQLATQHDRRWVSGAAWLTKPRINEAMHRATVRTSNEKKVFNSLQDALWCPCQLDRNIPYAEVRGNATFSLTGREMRNFVFSWDKKNARSFNRIQASGVESDLGFVHPSHIQVASFQAKLNPTTTEEAAWTRSPQIKITLSSRGCVGCSARFHLCPRHALVCNYVTDCLIFWDVNTSYMRHWRYESRGVCVYTVCIPKSHSWLVYQPDQDLQQLVIVTFEQVIILIQDD